MFLLDTMVVSEFAKRKRNPAVTAWLENENSDEMFISVLTIGEIKRGINLQRKKDPNFAFRLEDWLINFVKTYRNNFIPVNEKIAFTFGEIAAKTGNNGIDNLIAATAKVYNLIVVTRNVRHFVSAGVECMNPWE